MELVDPQAQLSEVEGEYPQLRRAWDDAVKATQEWDVDGEFGTVCSVCAIPEPEGEQVYGVGGEYTTQNFTIGAEPPIPEVIRAEKVIEAFSKAISGTDRLPSGGGSGTVHTGKSP